MNVAQFEQLTAAIWIYDIDNYRIEWANRPALKLWESSSLEELQSRSFESVTSDAVQDSLLEYRRAFSQNVVFSHNWHFSPNGIDKQAYCHFSSFTLDDGRVAMLVEALPIVELNKNAKIGSSVILSTYLTDGRFISGNPAFLQNMSRSINNISEIVVHPADLQKIYHDLTTRSRFEGDVLLHSEQGERWYHVVAIHSQRNPETNQKILLHQHDIHERKIGELELTQEVLSDSLTGLLNRRGFYRRLEEIEEKKEKLILFYIDLDGFKLINDSFGHDAGDQVLKSVSKRLLALLPEKLGSFVCRFGGDEFIVGVTMPSTGTSNFFDEGLLADSMVSSLSDIYLEYNSYPMTLSASIGLAHYPEDVEVITEAVFFADAAMYQAKESGKRRWVKYKEGMERTVRRKSIIAQSLFNAEKNQEMMLYYQPIWDFSEGKNCIVSFEALLRWHDDELGWVSAEDIVPVAEEIGIIDNIERWVVAKALSDLLVLREYVNPDVTMAVNISAVHLRVPELPEFLLSMIEASQLKPSDLTVELTESALIADIEDQNHVVRKLVDKGINISIDDFGTGYSSLAYLHHIPAKIVKIDRSFAERIEDSGKTVKHIQKLIEAHGMRALIEGVETEQQQEKLISFGVYLQQGFFKGKPKPLMYFTRR